MPIVHSMLLRTRLVSRAFSTTRQRNVKDLNTEIDLRCALTGKALLNSPTFNKGSAFTREERKEFGLEGLLPDNVQRLEAQAQRAYAQYGALTSTILKNSFMTSMHDQNQVLFYKLFEDHLKEFLPVVYTPGTAEAISNYSRLFRRPEGLFLKITDTAKEIDSHLTVWGQDGDVDYIICTDAEAILGIGDQGVGGIGISIAKLALMTLCGGLHPSKALPVMLDCGTNNQDLLNDDLYLGLRHERVTGEKYDAFLDRFVQAIRKRFPSSTLHFEDFGTSNAGKLLDKYKDDMCCFNDDSQGTSAVVLAALTAGTWVTKSHLKDQKVVLFGAGTAGIGIADRIRDAMESEGLSQEEALSRIFLLDRPGLLLQSHANEGASFKLSAPQKPYAKRDKDFESISRDGKVDLKSLIGHVKPDVLIGCSAQHGAFTKEVIEEMAKHVNRPIVLPLSNPTRLVEAVPADINEWTKGKALIATGSPFKPVTYQGKEYEVGEANNALVFPGIGYGCVLARASKLSDEMIIAAAKALASRSPALKDPDSALLPDVKYVRETSTYVAAAVILKAIEEGHARNEDLPNVKPGEEGAEEMRQWVIKHQWKAEYRPLRKVEMKDSSRKERGETGVGSVMQVAAQF